MLPWGLGGYTVVPSAFTRPSPNNPRLHRFLSDTFTVMQLHSQIFNPHYIFSFSHFSTSGSTEPFNQVVDTHNSNHKY